MIGWRNTLCMLPQLNKVGLVLEQLGQSIFIGITDC